MAVSSFSTVKAALGASFRNYGDRYFFTDAKVLGVTPYAQEVDGTAAVVTDAGVNQVLVPGVPGSAYLQYFVEQAFGGTAPQIQTAAAGGLVLQVDVVNNDGIFLGVPWCTAAGQGTLKTAGHGLFTGQTDAFYFRAKLVNAAVTDFDEVAVGIRKVQAFDTSGIVATNNTDFFSINNDNGTLKTLTNLNDAGVSSTSTTQTVANNVSWTIEIRVSSAGVVKSYVNGANPTVEVTNFTFDSGDLLMPYISIVRDATAGGAVGDVVLQEFEFGLLSDRGLDSITDTSN